jgi:hypothetical protein
MVKPEPVDRLAALRESIRRTVREEELRRTLGRDWVPSHIAGDLTVYLDGDYSPT